MYALIDCNNFYVSCERLFRPDLRTTPVIVLSNNDGAVISRSNEAKALGMKMGEPYFKAKAFCKQHKIQVFSSNYTLYRDLSQRVMAVIEQSWDEVDIYSVDEAFLDLKSMPVHLHTSFCADLQKYILKCTGIPTSIGIGPSKTLAKIANHICKKELKIPIFNISEQRQWLKKIAVGDIWGVGRQLHKRLVQQGIYTAHDLAGINLHILRTQYNVVLMRTAMELQGVSCANVVDAAPKQSILSSRSFGEMQSQYASLAQAISSHCSNACEKLRAQRSLVKSMYVFVKTNRFREDLGQYNQSIAISLVNPTDDLRLITHYAKQCLKKIYKPQFQYKKVGVCLDELVSRDHRQLDMFQQADQSLEKTEEFMTVFAAINRRYGRNTIKLAAEGYSKNWAMKSDLKSPAYTTQWAELAVVKNYT